MRKLILIVSIILFAFSLSCDEKVIQGKQDSKIRSLNISLGATYGGSYGFGKFQQNKKSTKEITANFQYKANNDYFLTGIYGQIKSFRNKERKGFFTLLTAGFDYTKGERKPIVFVPGGPNDDDYEKEKYEGLFPNLAIGCGFSMKLSLKSRLLLFIDFGIKRDFASLNIGYNFK